MQGEEIQLENHLRVYVHNTFLRVDDEYTVEAQKALHMRLSSSESSLGSKSRSSDGVASFKPVTSDNHLVWRQPSSPSESPYSSESNVRVEKTAMPLGRPESRTSQESGNSAAIRPGNQGWSVGSELHHEGHCSPCAWHWRDSGCASGEACDFCHLCGKDSQGGKLKLRKVKKAVAVATPLQPGLVPSTGSQDSSQGASPTALQPGLVPGSGAGRSPGSSQSAAASANVSSRSAVLQPVVTPGAGTGTLQGPAQLRKMNVGQAARSKASSAQASKNPLHKISL